MLGNLLLQVGREVLTEGRPERAVAALDQPPNDLSPRRQLCT